MRRKTLTVKVGDLEIGSAFPIRVQSMTDTPTADVQATTDQIIALYNAGSELVRFTVNNIEAAAAVPQIQKSLNKRGYAKIPLIGDFHFNGYELLSKYPEMAKTLDKYRINPGNAQKDFEKIIELAIKYNKPIRIGVNSGSIDRSLLKENTKSKAMVLSAISSALLAETIGLKEDQIIISIKSSDIDELIEVNQQLKKQLQKAQKTYPIHLGLTEAGTGVQGTVSSTVALTKLLSQGIGDTIRVSITPQPEKPRTEEVKIARAILQELGLRRFSPKVTSCPGCGRTDKEFFQQAVEKITAYLDQNTIPPDLHIAIMGCVVNGPGEAQNADIAIHLPGKTEQKSAALYIKGKFVKTLTGPDVPDLFIKELEDFCHMR